MSAITRAEVRRRFEDVKTYRILSRTFAGGMEAPPLSNHVRHITGVTSTGVHAEGTPYAVTRFDDPDAQWFDDGAGILRAEYPARNHSIGMTITYQLGEPEKVATNPLGLFCAECGTTTTDSYVVTFRDGDRTEVCTDCHLALTKADHAEIVESFIQWASATKTDIGDFDAEHIGAWLSDPETHLTISKNGVTQ